VARRVLRTAVSSYIKARSGARFNEAREKSQRALERAIREMAAVVIGERTLFCRAGSRTAARSIALLFGFTRGLLAPIRFLILFFLRFIFFIT
jgi:hypothetical protein